MCPSGKEDIATIHALLQGPSVNEDESRAAAARASELLLCRAPVKEKKQRLLSAFLATKLGKVAAKIATDRAAAAQAVNAKTEQLRNITKKLNAVPPLGEERNGAVKAKQLVCEAVALFRGWPEGSSRTEAASSAATAVTAWLASARLAALQWFGSHEAALKDRESPDRDSIREDHDNSGSVEQILTFIRDVEGLSDEWSINFWPVVNGAAGTPPGTPSTSLCLVAQLVETWIEAMSPQVTNADLAESLRVGCKLQTAADADVLPKMQALLESFEIAEPVSEALLNMHAKCRMKLNVLGARVKALCQDGGADSLPLTYDGAAACFEDGASVSTAPAVSIIRHLDVAVCMKKIENVVAAEYIFAAMDFEDDVTDTAKQRHSQTAASLKYLARALPACKAAVVFSAFNVKSVTDEEKFLLAFADFVKELPREDAEHGGALSQRLHMFKTKHQEGFKSKLREVINQLKKLEETIMPILLDLKEVFKNGLEEGLPRIINFEKRTDLVEQLKEVQGRAGLRRMDGLISAWQCCGALEPIDGEDVLQFRESMRDLRQRARLQISTRAAAIIVDKKRWHDIKSFKEDAMGLKTWGKIPPPLKQKLESMATKS